MTFHSSASSISPSINTPQSYTLTFTQDIRKIFAPVWDPPVSPPITGQHDICSLSSTAHNNTQLHSPWLMTQVQSPLTDSHFQSQFSMPPITDHKPSYFVPRPCFDAYEEVDPARARERTRDTTRNSPSESRSRSRSRSSRARRNGNKYRKEVILKECATFKESHTREFFEKKIPCKFLQCWKEERCCNGESYQDYRVTIELEPNIVITKGRLNRLCQEFCEREIPVDKIIGHDWDDHKRRIAKLKVVWEGYSELEATWEPFENLKHLRCVKKYFRANDISDGEGPGPDE